MSDATSSTGLTPTRIAFSLTVLLSAFLLFLVQPMFSKMALPLLGGAPAVWNTAMVFFQAVLLGGYAYAHGLSTFVPPKRQPVVHLFVCLLALTWMPIGLVGWWPQSEGGSEFFWLFGLFGASIGIPFFAVSANTPLIQSWFARSDDPDAEHPYFLYAASNMGSMVALLSYPLLVEPMVGLAEQAWFWSLGFGLLVCGLTVCSFLTFRYGDQVSEAVAEGADEEITWERRLRWLVLAAIPSGLMIGVTTFITTDVVAVPLLWVIPLALYLLTFVIAFATRPPITLDMAERIAPVALVAVALPMINRPVSLVSLVVLTLMSIVGFFFVALVCHSRLAAIRPKAANLTQFFMIESLGGVTGSAFVALAAPMMFNAITETPILLSLAAWLGVSATRSKEFKGSPVAATLATIVALFALAWTSLIWRETLQTGVGMPMLIGSAAAAVASFAYIMRSPAFVAVLVTLLSTLSVMVNRSPNQLYQERSFFGVYRVSQQDHGIREIHHGTTRHGSQAMTPDRECVAMSYHAPEGGAGKLMKRLKDDATVGVVGLGAGAMASYKKGTQDWTIFEIDPLVKEIAEDPEMFTYLSTCSTGVKIDIGDARLALQTGEFGPFDLLGIDAFSSDVVPLHLLTKEAFQAYGEVLTEGGILTVHISNRHFDLEPAVAAVLADLGWSSKVMAYVPDKAARELGAGLSTWVAISKTPAPLANLPSEWRAIRTEEGFRVWTDDYSNVLAALR